MDDVRIKVRLERLEVGPSPASEELVLQMPEVFVFNKKLMI